MGQNIINPLATIPAAQMMQEHLDGPEAASVLQDTIKKVLKNDLKRLEAGNRAMAQRKWATWWSAISGVETVLLEIPGHCCQPDLKLTTSTKSQ